MYARFTFSAKTSMFPTTAMQAKTNILDAKFPSSKNTRT